MPDNPPVQIDLQVIVPGDDVDGEERARRAARMRHRVCRIEWDNEAMGTGFLVGKDLVLTNWHVIDKRPGIAKWSARFDFRIGENQTLPDTRPHAVTAIEMKSPASPLDRMAHPPSDPGLDQLDYALLRLNAPAGLDMVGGTVKYPEIRGWIDLPKEPYVFRAEEYLAIIQHPIGAPQRTFERDDSLMSVNAIGTRLCHRTRTLDGSSGSPCFNRDWRWVAMHQGGDAIYHFNRAIPAWEIAQDMRKGSIEFEDFDDRIWRFGVLDIKSPDCIDFRGRGDPGDPGWRDEPAMVTLQPLTFALARNAPTELLYLKSTLRLPQFPAGRNFRSAWKVMLNEAGGGFLGCVGDMEPILLKPGENWSHEVMFRCQSEAEFIRWESFVNTALNLAKPTLKLSVRHEFDKGHIEEIYALSVATLQNYLRLASENEFKFPKFVQPEVLSGESP